MLRFRERENLKLMFENMSIYHHLQTALTLEGLFCLMGLNQPSSPTTPISVFQLLLSAGNHSVMNSLISSLYIHLPSLLYCFQTRLHVCVREQKEMQSNICFLFNYFCLVFFNFITQININFSTIKQITVIPDKSTIVF